MAAADEAKASQQRLLIVGVEFWSGMHIKCRPTPQAAAVFGGGLVPPHGVGCVMAKWGVAAAA